MIRKPTGRVWTASKHVRFDDAIRIAHRISDSMWRVYGHGRPRTRTMMVARYQIGDIIAWELKSGTHGLFVLTKIDYKLDPRDEFFGECEFITYKGNEAWIEQHYGVKLVWAD